MQKKTVAGIINCLTRESASLVQARVPFQKDVVAHLERKKASYAFHDLETSDGTQC